MQPQLLGLFSFVVKGRAGGYRQQINPVLRVFYMVNRSLYGHQGNQKRVVILAWRVLRERLTKMS